MKAEGSLQEAERIEHLLATAAVVRPVPVRARYLDPHALCVRQFEETTESCAACTEARIGPAEMVHDDSDACFEKRLDDVWQPRGFGVYFDMPIQFANMRERLRTQPLV